MAVFEKAPDNNKGKVEAACHTALHKERFVALYNEMLMTTTTTAEHHV